MDEGKKLDYLMGQFQALSCAVKTLSYRMTTAQRSMLEECLAEAYEAALEPTISDSYRRGLDDMALELKNASK